MLMEGGTKMKRNKIIKVLALSLGIINILGLSPQGTKLLVNTGIIQEAKAATEIKVSNTSTGTVGKVSSSRNLKAQGVAGDKYVKFYTGSSSITVVVYYSDGTVKSKDLTGAINISAIRYDSASDYLWYYETAYSSSSNCIEKLNLSTLNKSFVKYTSAESTALTYYPITARALTGSLTVTTDKQLEGATTYLFNDHYFVEISSSHKYGTSNYTTICQVDDNDTIYVSGSITTATFNSSDSIYNRQKDYKISLKNTVDGAKYYYTTDGTTPTISSTEVESNSIYLDGPDTDSASTITVNVLGVKNDVYTMTTSKQVTFPEIKYHSVIFKDDRGTILVNGSIATGCTAIDIAPELPANYAWSQSNSTSTMDNIMGDVEFVMTPTVVGEYTDEQGIVYSCYGDDTAVIKAGTTSEVGSPNAKESIVIKDKVTYNDKEYSVKSIGQYALPSTSTNLTVSTEILNNSTGISLDSISNLKLTGNINSLKLSTFGLTNIVNCDLSEYTGDIVESMFENTTTLTNVKLNKSMNNINVGFKAFYGCSALETVDYMGSLSLVGGSEFYSCTNLKDLDNIVIKSVGAKSFSRCNTITQLDLSQCDTVPDDIVEMSTGISYMKMKESVLGSGTFTGLAYKVTFYDEDEMTYLGGYVCKKGVNLNTVQEKPIKNGYELKKWNRIAGTSTITNIQDTTTFVAEYGTEPLTKLSNPNLTPNKLNPNNREQKINVMLS